MKNLFNSKNVIRLLILCFSFALIYSFASAQISGGGNYTLTQSAIANGGASGSGASLGGTYSLEGTIGQSAAGTNQQAQTYNFKPGFWTAQSLAPTAASVSVVGRILTKSGRGIRNVRVTLTTPSGEIRTAISSSFGYFRFTEVLAGGTYVFSVFAKRYTFNEPTQIRSITEDISDLFFISNAEVFLK